MTLEDFFKYVKTHEIDLNELFEYEIEIDINPHVKQELCEIKVDAFNHKIILNPFELTS